MAKTAHQWRWRWPGTPRLQALSPGVAAVMGNDDDVVARVVAAGETTGERHWRLPLVATPVWSERGEGWLARGAAGWGTRMRLSAATLSPVICVILPDSVAGELVLLRLLPSSVVAGSRHGVSPAESAGQQ